MNIWLRMIPALVLLFLLSSCGSDQQSVQSTQSYKDTKTIVLDVLKTEDAQRAILEANAKNQDKTLKLLATGDGQQIQLAVKDILTGPESEKLLERTMTDPRFAGDFAKALQKNMKQLHKDLLKDPEYQKAMLEALNNPDYEKLMLTTMKKTAYRQQTMQVIQESMQSPLFRAQLMDIFKKVVEEETKPKQLQAQSTGGGQQAGSTQGGGQDKSQGQDQQQKGKTSQDGGDSGDQTDQQGKKKKQDEQT